jgi:hypothetical protein
MVDGVPAPSTNCACIRARSGTGTEPSMIRRAVGIYPHRTPHVVASGPTELDKALANVAFTLGLKVWGSRRPGVPDLALTHEALRCTRAAVGVTRPQLHPHTAGRGQQTPPNPCRPVHCGRGAAVRRSSQARGRPPALPQGSARTWARAPRYLFIERRLGFAWPRPPFRERSCGEARQA